MSMTVGDETNSEEKEMSIGELGKLDGEKKEAIHAERIGMTGSFTIILIFLVLILTNIFKGLWWNPGEEILGIMLSVDLGPNLGKTTESPTVEGKGTAQQEVMMHLKLLKGWGMSGNTVNYWSYYNV